MKPIYEPKGRAKEYCEHAVNIFRGCSHRCTYCYGPDVLHITKEEYYQPKHRSGLLEAMQRQLATDAYDGREIQLCFIGDPYDRGMDTEETREAIKLIHAAGAKARILTKGGYNAQRDHDMLDLGDWFGVTITGDDTKEPGAAPSIERIDALKEAWRHGIPTWISCEPVYDVEAIYRMLIALYWVDEFKIGKLNHYPSEIDWAVFGRECERLGKQYGRNIYIKQDLRDAMNAPGGDHA